jgi:hypothetical protein
MDRATGFYPVGWGFESLRGHVSKTRKQPEYPRPKRGERVKCSGCTNGKVMKADRTLRDCTACEGTGFIVAR